MMCWYLAIVIIHFTYNNHIINLQYGLFKADVGHTNKRSICVRGRSHDRQAIPSIEDGQPGHTERTNRHQHIIF